MSSKLKGLPSRVKIREQDSATGSYPTIARTGDFTRTGAYSILWDDRRTIDFVEYSNLAMPAGLALDSPHINEEITSSISVVGNAVKGVGDVFSTFVNSGESLGPFIEDSLFEQNKTGSFYMTGSSHVRTGLGFSSPLKSKTQVRFRLPISASTTLSAQTSSIYYYNNTYKVWDRIRSDLETDPIHSYLQSTAASEGKLFGPFGSMMVSGTSNLTSPTSGFYIFGTPDNEESANTQDIPPMDISFPAVGMVKPLLPHPQVSESLNSNDLRYAASDECLITPDIQHPFLIEKIIIRVPVEAGPGWTGDRTTVEHSGTFSYGGPALTLALQRQIASDRREIIVSGSIIPSGDNASASFSTNKNNTSPQGFLSFGGTPAATVIPDSNGFFSGSVLMEMIPAISNGVISCGFEGTYGYGSFSFGSLFTGSLIISINPFGRSTDGRMSGRSFFGRDLLSPGSDNDIIRPLYEDTFTAEHIHYVAHSHAVSPYLLLPNDKLLLSISKSRPVHSGCAELTPPSGYHGYGGLLTGSHDIKIASGRMDVTMYGSLVRNLTEFHDTLNQPLTSDAIHEAIYGDCVVDQYDVEDRSVFSGSYIDNIISGTIGLVVNRGSRGVEGSALNRRKSNIDRKDVGEVSGSLIRGMRLCSAERYWDTLLPRPDQITAINGGDILYHIGGQGGSPYKTDMSLGWIQLGPPPGWGSWNGGYDSSTDDVWYRSFPFESRYATVERTLSPFRQVMANKGLIISGSLPTSQRSISKVGLLENESTQATTSSTVFKDLGNLRPQIAEEVPDVTTFDDIKIARAYYGIGEGFQGSAKKITTTYDYNQANGIIRNYRFVQIRGWKYGLKNALPVNSSAVFRRDRYGQFRDMLEQRQYTKFYITRNNENEIISPTVCQSPVQIIFSETDPEDTFCSNMSLEATSSVPFFDADRGDLGRNRGILPDVEIIRFD